VVSFAILLILFSALAIGIGATIDWVRVGEPFAEVLFACMMIPFAVVTVYWAWKTGHYAQRGGQ
jgi:hypothetical protein